MLYWFFKWFSIGPLTRLLFRPWIEGEEGTFFVRTRYVRADPPTPARLFHPYRTLPVRLTLSDLWRAES